MKLDLPDRLRRHERIAVTPGLLANLDLQSGFVSVWYYRPQIGPSGIDWLQQDHVDDHETFLATVEATFERRKCNYALWDDGTKWCLLSHRTGDTRRYPSREAAEMVAIHDA